MRNNTCPAVIDFDGLYLFNISMLECLDAIENVLRQHDKFFRIGFMNADCFNIAACDADYRAQLNKLDWIFADGSGIRWAGEILSQPVRDNVNGTDLFPLLCQRLAISKHKVFLLGGKPDIAAKAAKWAMHRYPGLNVSGCHHGYFEDVELVKMKIKQSGASVLLVGFGAPLQEQWINRHAEDTGINLALGVGGLFDYYSGSIPRAPLWMRRIGIEWVFRLIQEPSRLWRRYLIGNTIFIFRVLGMWGRLMLKRRPK